MYSRMVLMVVCWRYGMPFDTNGCVTTLVNVDWKKWVYSSVNDSIFSGNEQQKGVLQTTLLFNLVARIKRKPYVYYFSGFKF